MIKAIISSLLRVLANPVAAAFSLLWGLEAEMQRLQNDLEVIKAVLGEAEERQYREEPVRIWLQQLKSVAYDAVDVFDELKMVAALHPRLLTEADAAVTIRSVRLVSTCFLSCFTATPNPLVFRHQMGCRIQNIMARLSGIRERNHGLLRLTGVRNQPEPYPTRETSFLPKRDQLLLGRDIQKQQLIQVLCADNDDRVPFIVPIVGIGGIGKTTLAQAVYSDGRIEGQFPQMRKWVFVGEKFDARKIIEELLSEASKQKIIGMNPTLNYLHELLKSEIQDKTFLIVLDDMWTEKEEEWDQLWRPLEHGGKGSRVIVTTRSPQVANMRGPVPLTITLEPLSSEECWSIVEKCAFIDRNRSSEECPEMKVIGWEIVKKLKGVPLAAKLIGEALGRNFDTAYWNRLMDSDTWLHELEREGVLPSLLLSYQALPSNLKPCFAFCSLFPKDHRFNRETLVWMWMAHDFIQPVGSQRMEDVGRNCFDELLQRSFFQYVDYSYVMHDLIHDLAEFVSGGECLRVEDEKKPCSKPDGVHHISLLFDFRHVLEPKYLNQFNRARTLTGSISRFIDASDQNFCRLLGRLTSLRVLDLSSCWFLKSLPEDITNLKHLRYLDIRNSGIWKLPESLCTVHNLQTLRVREHPSCEFPRGMSKLVNLRNLQAGRKHISEIAGIGKLTCLQELKGPFKVLSKDVQEGRSIRELRGLNQLGGTLCIENLEKVGSSEEAAEARLQDKVFLHRLELVYGRDVFENQEAICEQVMEELQPPRQIKELALRRYPGSQPPNWMTGDSPWLSSLVTLELLGCKNWTCLPAALGMLSCLKSLQIQGLEGVKQVGPEFLSRGAFPSLEALRFYNMGGWERWVVEEERKDDNAVLTGQEEGHSRNPRLRSVSIRRCPKLISIAALLRHHRLQELQFLAIRDCKELAHLMGGIDEGGKLPSHCYQRMLHFLSVRNCPKLAWSEMEPFLSFSSLRSLNIGFQRDDLAAHSGFFRPPQEISPADRKPLQRLVTSNRELLRWLLQPRESLLESLRYLRITGCDELISFTDEEEKGWRLNLPSVRELHFRDCQSLRSLPTSLPPTLQQLYIDKCPNLQSLQTSLPPTLKKLYIDKCPNLQSLPTSLPAELQDLRIEECPNLQSLPTRLPPTLEYFLLRDCLSLLSLQTSHPPTLQQLDMEKCPNLQSLPTRVCPTWQHWKIKECPNLQALLSIPPSLRRLEIMRCPRLEEVAWLEVEPDLIGSSSSTPSPSSSSCTAPVELFELTTDNRRLLSWLLLQPRRLDSLYSLTIKDCVDLETFTEEEKEGWRRNLPSLSHLSFRGCPNLLCFPEGFPVEPKIWDCPKFQSDELLTFWNWGNVLGA